MILDLPPTIEQIIIAEAQKQGQDPTTWLIEAIQAKAQPSYAKGDFDFDLERMKEAIGETDENGRAKNTVEIPKSAMKDLATFQQFLRESFA